MHNIDQRNSFLYHSETHSPYASTSRVTLEAMSTQIYSLPQRPPQRPPSSGPRHHPSRRYIPLPPTVDGHVELNPLLLSRNEVLIRYSLAAPPTAASAFGNNDRWMLEPATRPNLRSMTITTSDLIPWPIIIHASNINPFVVTVGDVLAAVHGALHTLITEREYRLALLPNTAATRVVRNHYRNGMRRLDLLNERCWWAGLSESQEGPEIWNLHLQQ
ncbi:hypothetical protein BD779DRAFT_1584580 [Infundibulicybe gibba]|nr:hypothetical protein BD779DRAFT_1584580 [Infundibulicybe gibba]